MHIEHIALWTANLEGLKTFYETYFQARAGDKYANPAKGFESYFLTFASGARLELMRMPAIPASLNDPQRQSRKAARSGCPAGRQFTGYVHLAVSVGSQGAVDALTARLGQDGYRVVDGPRHTGDGYYESCVLDPDGNRVEITI
jgi:lactoylglutathione lyase